MVSRKLIRFDCDRPEFMDPETATAEDWAFFSKNLWRSDFGVATLHVGWSNNYDIQNGYYICRLLINEDWANPVEEFYTRDASRVNSWVHERTFYLVDDIEKILDHAEALDRERYPALY